MLINATDRTHSKHWQTVILITQQQQFSQLTDTIAIRIHGTRPKSSPTATGPSIHSLSLLEKKRTSSRVLDYDRIRVSAGLGQLSGNPPARMCLRRRAPLISAARARQGEKEYVYVCGAARMSVHYG